MNELQVFLVSEIGEIHIGSAQQVIDYTCSTIRRRSGTEILLMDLLGDMISNGSMSSSITVELRDPTGEQDVI